LQAIICYSPVGCIEIRQKCVGPRFNPDLALKPPILANHWAILSKFLTSSSSLFNPKKTFHKSVAELDETSLQHKGQSKQPTDASKNKKQ